jgi:tetratricopeptide (TPR) repeat protein
MRLRLAFVPALAVASVCLALGAYGAYAAGQPVVSCASAPRKPLTAPPAALTTARDYFIQGNYEYEQGKCDQAINDYTRAIELNPYLPEAYNNRAYVYMVKKDYASALSDLDMAIELRPDYVNALMNRGDIYNYYYSIDYTRAVADYDHVLRVDPDAQRHTSVCGHRLLAMNHGWNLNVLLALAVHGPTAGCGTKS